MSPEPEKGTLVVQIEVHGVTADYVSGFNSQVLDVTKLWSLYQAGVGYNTSVAEATFRPNSNRAQAKPKT